LFGGVTGGSETGIVGIIGMACDVASGG